MSTQSVDAHGWVPSTDAFGARLALVRNREAWNVKEAALACGLPVESWRRWERGGKPHDHVEVCRVIAARTGCDYDWLLDGRPRRGVGTGVGHSPPVQISTQKSARHAKIKSAA